MSPVLLPVRGLVRGVTSSGLGPERHRELVAARKLLEMAESKMLQEERRRTIQQRSPQSLSTADHVDQPALVK